MFDLKKIDSELKEYLECDEQLLKIAKEFKILTLIEWPKKNQEEFINSYRRGEKKNPQITYMRHKLSDSLKNLESIIERTSTEHPLAKYLNETATSYFFAHRLVESLGQPDMVKYSIKIYGRPGDNITGSSYTSLDAAQFFIETADEFSDYYSSENNDVCVLAETVKNYLEIAIKDVITDDKINIYIDHNLVPKAAAGVERVRLRSGTCFSKYDSKQLLEHEIFVHTLTALNGRAQPYVKTLSLGAPRTTATQEGLAIFAELITGAIDLERLKRIALRVVAVDMALNGANFVDVFEYFIQNKQSENESYSSAQRIFRGGDPNGKIAFTKDSVYLDGLLHAHSFFRWAMKNSKLNLANILFSGRMTFDDAQRLKPFVTNGLIIPPKYLPPWLTQVPTLGGYLAFSLFANKIRVGVLDEQFNSN